MFIFITLHHVEKERAQGLAKAETIDKRIVLHMLDFKSINLISSSSAFLMVYVGHDRVLSDHTLAEKSCTWNRSSTERIANMWWHTLDE